MTFPPPENYTDLDLKIHFHSHPGTAKGKDDVASGKESRLGDIPMAIHCNSEQFHSFRYKNRGVSIRCARTQNSKTHYTLIKIPTSAHLWG